MSTYPEPATDGFFCRRCGVHRTRSAVSLCPVCADDAITERATATPRRPAP